MHWSTKVKDTLDGACDKVDAIAENIGDGILSGFQKLDGLAERTVGFFDADYSTREDIAKKHGFGELDTIQQIEGMGTGSITRYDNGSVKVGFSPDAMSGVRLDTFYQKENFLPQLNYETSRLVLIDGQQADMNYKLGGENISGSPLSGGKSVELDEQSAAQVAIVLENTMNPDYEGIREKWTPDDFIDLVRGLKTTDGQPALVRKNDTEEPVALEVNVDENSL